MELIKTENVSVLIHSRENNDYASLVIKQYVIQYCHVFFCLWHFVVTIYNQVPNVFWAFSSCLLKFTA